MARRGGLVMRVLQVITKGDVGGAQTHVVELAAALRDAGDEVHVATGIDGPAMDRLRAATVPVTIVPEIAHSSSPLVLRRGVQRIAELLRAEAPDIVHAHSSHAGLLVRLAARRVGCASVYTAHGWPFQKGAAWTQRVSSIGGEWIGGRLGDAVICLTEAERDRALRAHVAAPDRIRIVPNGLRDVDPDLVRHVPDTGPAAIVMVARFAAPKRQAELIETMAGLTEDNWTLTFVGDGPQLGACQELGQRLLGDRVRFLGNRTDVEAILASHDVAVLWSAYEGLPISMLEAMRAGLCCVGSDLPGVRTLLAGPDVGIVAGSAEELGRQIKKLCGDRSRIRALGGLARQRFEQRYSASAMAAATRSVYREVLASRAARGERARTRGARR